jgi:5-methylcytosine-specific restriction enzyme A
VPISELTEPLAVHAAIAEFDELGRDAFLEKHGYRRARQYFLRAPTGRFYDSKAIAGVAYGYQFPEHGPLRSAEFSGGEATVKSQLERLGFEIARNDQSYRDTEGQRNPLWIRDELILALDLYVQLGGQGFSHNHPGIVGCSELLNKLQRLLGTARSDTLRNQNGVYMKLMNFRRFDPVFTDTGRQGLARGNRLEEEVWRTFHSDPGRLANVAKAIRDQLTAEHKGEAAEAGILADNVDDEDFEAPEGRILTRLHRQRERNRTLVAAKKQRALALAGNLKCEACGFDFVATYGERGQGFMECHHIKPVETLTENSRTKVTDLALVCANCHRMIHAKRPWLSIDALRATLATQ